MDEKIVTYCDFVEVNPALTKPTKLDTSLLEEFSENMANFFDEISDSVLNRVAMDICRKCRKVKRGNHLGLPWCICRKAKKRIAYELDRVLLEVTHETD